MSKLIDAAFGIHPKALAVGARRLEVLAANMANADTPGYKARDIGLRSALREAARALLELTHEPHRAGHTEAAGELKYRLPNQPSLEGKSVDAELEQPAFA